LFLGVYLQPHFDNGVCLTLVYCLFPYCTVLQLCYNHFTGSIPTQLGTLTKLNVLALQSNQLTGAIPASLGDLGVLMRVDLSYNSLFGSIPSKLADAPLLEVLDIRNNKISGNVPLGNEFSRPTLYSLRWSFESQPSFF